MILFHTHHKELHTGQSITIQLHFLFELHWCPTADGSHSCRGCSNIYVFLLVLIIRYLDIQILSVLLSLHHTIGASLLRREGRNLNECILCSRS